MLQSLEMEGPYQLSFDIIDRIVKKDSPGNFALGHFISENSFIQYIGRSDQNIRECLKNWVGFSMHFKFSYASDSQKAYEKECQNYHDFVGRDYYFKPHPKKPENTDYKCPVCKI